MRHSAVLMVSNYMTRYFGERPIRFYCLAVMLFAATILVTAFATERRGRTVFGSNLGADFVQFYVAGVIFNNYSGERLYDLELQQQIFKEMFPDEPDAASLPFFYPPYFALPSSLIARLPYRWAFATFLLIVLVLYLAALHLLRGALEYIPADNWLTIVLLAVAFMPFIFEAWMGGQVSAWGFLAFALVFRFEKLGRPLVAGLALAICSYKPTLLVLAIPMLLITRRGTMLLGFSLGGLAIAMVSTALYGLQTYLAYLGMLFGYGRAIAIKTIGLRLWKYIDVNSQLKLMGGSLYVIRLITIVVLAVAVLWFLLCIARRVRRVAIYEWDLMWGVTLTWTLLLNAYVPIYDSILVIPAVLLSLNFLARQKPFDSLLTSSYRALLALIHLVPWLTQSVARTVGVQPYSLVLVGLGLHQLRILRTSSARLESHITTSRGEGAPTY